MTRSLTRSLVSITLTFALTAGLAAQEYGTLKGTFVLEGKAPEPVKLVINKDEAVCGKMPQFSQNLIVAKDGGLANTVIYAMGDPQKTEVPVKNIHPSYDRLKGTEVKLDNKVCRFEPHVAKMWTEQKLLLTNSDPVSHNSFVQPFNNPGLNPVIPSGQKAPLDFKKGEKIPVVVTCSIHPWMKAWVVVRPDPYADVSKESGQFAIENIPVGEHTFLLWHESLLYLSKINVGGKPQTGIRGQHKFTIKAGDNDLGKIVIKATDHTKELKRLK
jgi:hypothetical protein